MEDKKMFENYILYGIIVLIAILYLVETYRHDKKESELLNRLMSRDFADYAYGSKILEKRQKKEKTVNDLMEKGEKTLPVY